MILVLHPTKIALPGRTPSSIHSHRGDDRTRVSFRGNPSESRHLLDSESHQSYTDRVPFSWNMFLWP